MHLRRSRVLLLFAALPPWPGTLLKSRIFNPTSFARLLTPKLPHGPEGLSPIAAALARGIAIAVACFLRADERAAAEFAVVHRVSKLSILLCRGLDFSNLRHDWDERMPTTSDTRGGGGGGGGPRRSHNCSRLPPICSSKNRNCCLLHLVVFIDSRVSSLSASSRLTKLSSPRSSPPPLKLRALDRFENCRSFLFQICAFRRLESCFVLYCIVVLYTVLLQLFLKVVPFLSVSLIN